MRKTLSVLGRIVKYVFFSFLAFSVVALFAVTMFEHRLPVIISNKIAAKLSNDNVLVRTSYISFRFPDTLKIHNLRVLDRSKITAKPMLSASKIDVRLRFDKMPWSRESILESVTVYDLHYPRLNDGYYIPDSIEFPGQTDFKEIDSPLKMILPRLETFKLTLIRPRILGVVPKSVSIPKVSSSSKGLKLGEIFLQWSDADIPMSLTGGLTLDLVKQYIRGNVKGQARQHNIRPMLGILEITNSYPYIDGFTNVELPVNALCDFDINLRKGDLHLFLDLHPTGGSYNGVPLLKADGQLDINVFVRDIYQNALITIGPIDAKIADGKYMKGTIVYENTKDIGYVNFDVVSTTSLSNALAIADVLNDGTLDCLVPEVNPYLTLKGRLAVNPQYAATNDLYGTIAFEKGTFFSIPLTSASAVYQVKGTDVIFSNARGSAPNGGTITGNGLISVPGFEEENARFKVSIKCKNVALEDAAEALNFDIGNRHGRLNGKLELSGPLGSNLVSRIKGKGHIVCKEGYLSQMKLFAGLTDYFAKTIPGIEKIVTQSNGEVVFDIKDGFIHIEKLVIEGSGFSILVKGSYNMVKDNLDITARVQLFKDKSIFAKLLSPVTWTLSEFKVFGTLEKPDWRYLHPINRIID